MLPGALSFPQRMSIAGTDLDKTTKMLNATFIVCPKKIETIGQEQNNSCQ